MTTLKLRMIAFGVVDVFAQSDLAHPQQPQKNQNRIVLHSQGCHLVVESVATLLRVGHRLLSVANAMAVAVVDVAVHHFVDLQALVHATVASALEAVALAVLVALDVASNPSRESPAVVGAVVQSTLVRRSSARSAASSPPPNVVSSARSTENEQAAQ
jgi:hypothetical protein